MPLTLPNLDDRTYTDLVDEAISLIPNFAPEWTNHNPSDPGITLIELFAYLTELLLYRQNQITEDSLRVFLKLINGANWQQTQPLDEEIRLAVLQVRDRYRAVTVQDFEWLVEDYLEVARARCLPRRNLEASGAARQQDAPAHVSVVLVPKLASLDPAVATLQPRVELRQQIARDLEARRLLTTQVHVVGPRYVAIGVRVRLVLTEEGRLAAVQNAAIEALERFLHPLSGGPEEKGWPFGRSIYVSEIYKLLDQLPGVDYVTPIETQDELFMVAQDMPNRLVRNTDNELFAITLEPDELVEAQINADDLVMESPIQPFRVS